MADEQVEDPTTETAAPLIGPGGHAPDPPAVEALGVPGGSVGDDHPDGQDTLGPAGRPGHRRRVRGSGVVLAGVDAVGHRPAGPENLLAQRPGRLGGHEPDRDRVHRRFVHGRDRNGAPGRAREAGLLTAAVFWPLREAKCNLFQRSTRDRGRRPPAATGGPVRTWERGRRRTGGERGRPWRSATPRNSRPCAGSCATTTPISSPPRSRRSWPRATASAPAPGGSPSRWRATGGWASAGPRSGAVRAAVPSSSSSSSTSRCAAGHRSPCSPSTPWARPS